MLVDAVTDRRFVIFLESHQPLLISLPIGWAVASMAGTIWLTQEGVATDVILHKGDKFDVAQKGSIVLHAVDGPGRVDVTKPPGPPPHRACRIAALLTDLAALILRKKPRVISVAIGFELTNEPLSADDVLTENRNTTVYFGSTAYGFGGLIKEKETSV